MISCKNCNKQFEPQKINRVHGEWSSVSLGGFCSAQCYTKSVTEGTEGQNKKTTTPAEKLVALERLLKDNLQNANTTLKYMDQDNPNRQYFQGLSMAYSTALDALREGK